MPRSGDLTDPQNTAHGLTFRQILILLSLPLIGWFLWQVQIVIALALLGLLLAVGLWPAVAFLQRRNLPRTPAIGLVYIGLLTPLAGLLFGAGRVMVAESQALLALFPPLLSAWQKLAADNPLFTPPDAAFRIFSSISANSLRAASGSAILLAAGLLILVIAYYLLAQHEMLWAAALQVMPIRHRRMIDLLGREITARARGYFHGVIISAVIIGSLTGIGLAVLGVPYPFLFGVLAGVLEVVPLVGPVIAAVGPILLVLGQSPLRAGLVLLFFVVLQQVEDKVLVVRIQASTTGLHPLTVIFSLLTMGVLFGLTGVLLAVPVAAALQACAICLTSCFLHPNGHSAWLAEREEIPVSDGYEQPAALNAQGGDRTTSRQEEIEYAPAVGVGSEM
ncbi:MAG: AI-2E family transporter [Chloroflexi bacterium]|nr:AI-2E family transporter [Chloroflexota bacterium]